MSTIICLLLCLISDNARKILREELKKFFLDSKVFKFFVIIVLNTYNIQRHKIIFFLFFLRGGALKNLFGATFREKEIRSTVELPTKKVSKYERDRIHRRNAFKNFFKCLFLSLLVYTTPSCWPTFTKAATVLSMSSSECAALI